MPLDVSPKLWLDATDGSTVTTSTGVTAWADKSGGANHVTQPFNASWEPSYTASIINGLHAVGFDGTKFLLSADDADLYLPNDFSVFAVVRFTQVAKGPTQQNTILSRGTFNYEFTEYQSHTTGSVAGVGFPAGTATLLADTDYVMEWHRNGSAVTCKVNGVADSSFTRADGLGSGALVLGARPSGSTDLYLKGYIGEVVACDAFLSSGDRDDLYAYLESKWLGAATVEADLDADWGAWSAHMDAAPDGPVEATFTADWGAWSATLAAGSTVDAELDADWGGWSAHLTAGEAGTGAFSADWGGWDASLTAVQPQTISLGTINRYATINGIQVTLVVLDGEGNPVPPDEWAFTVIDSSTGAPTGGVAGVLEGSGWEAQWSNVGAGTLVIEASNPAVINRGDVIRCHLRGRAAFQWIATTSVLQKIPGDGSESEITWTGPGRAAALSGARVYPSRGFGAYPVEEVRSFGWPSVDYGDGSWTTLSVGLGPQGIPTSYWYGLADWPEPAAEWMWSPGASQNYSLTGDVYFRTEFEVESAKWYEIHLAVDDMGALYIDGQQLITTGSWDNTNSSIRTAKVVLSEGTHTIAVWGNNGDGQVGNNPAGVLVAVMPEGGGPSIFNSGPGWKCLPYPWFPPGVSIGHALERVLYEAQTAGRLPGLSWTFDDTVDSSGNPWPYLNDITARVGSDILSLLRAHAGTDLQYRMQPGGYVLDVYTVEGGGVTRPITLDVPTDQTDPLTGIVLGQTNTTEGAIATAAVVHWADGWLMVDATPDGEEPVEILLELTHITAAAEAERSALAELALLADLREQIVVDVDMDATTVPWTHYAEGDTITVRNTAGALVEERVVALSAVIAGDEISVSPTLKDRILETTERHEEWLKAMADGAARGTAGAVGPPVSPPPSEPPRPTRELEWSLDTWDAVTGGSHGFNGRITSRRLRLDLDDVATGTCTATLRYAPGGATIGTVTVPAGSTTGSADCSAVVDNGERVEVVTTGSEGFGGNITYEYR